MLRLDFLLHAVVSFGLVLAFALFMPTAYAALIALSIGVAKEAVDHFKGGEFCLADIGFNMLGAFGAVALLLLAGHA